MTTLTHSKQVNEIAAALAKAQGEIEGAKKDSANPFFKSSYADLASVRAAIRGPLSRYGLSILQSPSAEGSKVSVETMVMHSSGQWLRGIVTATAKDDGPQAIGSLITYLRRYALQSFTGVAPEDDDGNAAEAKGKPQVVKAMAPPGYVAWLESLTAASDKGSEHLKAFWSTSAAHFRKFVTENSPDTWEDLKAHAKSVKPELVGA